MRKKLSKIAITGGKGGTGKSTYSVLLANKFVEEGKKVVLCDCDIECPNDYLLLEQKLKAAAKKIYTEFPKLIKNKCIKCGKCVKTCRSNAVFQAPEKHPVFIKDLCSACGACWLICPQNAIKPEKEQIGRVFNSKVGENYWLVTGLAKSGLEETGPVVAETKKFALRLAEKIKADIILFDTAAGTHCPVISALLGVDFAYAVTEPTPMGAYDLRLILNLCKKLKVPVKIILNQADLGKKKLIEDVLDEFNIKKIEQEILYSKKIVEAYSKGQLLNFQL